MEGTRPTHAFAFFAPSRSDDAMPPAPSRAIFGGQSPLAWRMGDLPHSPLLTGPTIRYHVHEAKTAFEQTTVCSNAGRNREPELQRCSVHEPPITYSAALQRARASGYFLRATARADSAEESWASITALA